MHLVLPTWLERWLGVAPSGAGQATVWELETTWGLAAGATALLILLCIAWVTFFYSREAASRPRRAVLALLRIASIAIVLLMIAELMLSLRRTGLPTVAVVVDDSASMGIIDRYGAKTRAALERQLRRDDRKQLSRLNIARSLLAAKSGGLLRELDEDYKLKLYSLSDTARLAGSQSTDLEHRLAELEPRGNASLLGSGIRQIIDQTRGAPPAAIIILSDGITTAGESLSQAAQLARAKNIPLFTVAVGSAEPPRDVELSEVLVDNVVFVDDVVTFEARLRVQGLAGRKIELELRETGKPAVLARRTITLGSAPVGTARLTFRPQTVGQYLFDIVAVPLADEVDRGNNSQQRSVTVRKERIRVLLVESTPSYEFRYLSNLLARDRTVELKTVLGQADLEHAQSDPSALRSFPVRREELFAYDVVILLDVNPALLTTDALVNIRALVEQKGRGLAIVSGPKYMPLALVGSPLEPLLPIELSAASLPDPDTLAGSFSVKPTELSLASPHMQLRDNAEENERAWAELPQLHWLLSAPKLKPAARVLAVQHPAPDEAHPLPVIAMQYFGAGKVLFHATDESWRWRFRRGDDAFGRYWGQAVRYLSHSKLLEGDRGVLLRAERPEVRRGESVQLRAQFVDERRAPPADDGVRLVVERAGFANETVTLRRSAAGRGHFEGTYLPTAEGTYRARLIAPSPEAGAATADFRVLPPPGERERTVVDLDELKAAAAISRGRFYDVAAASRLPDDLPAGRQVPIEPLPPYIIWNKWWMLLLLLTLLVSEWVLRKRSAMV